MFEYFKDKIFKINKQDEFNSLAIEIFRFQAENCTVYRDYLYYLNKNIKKINYVEQIPFLPIIFFKHYPILSVNADISKLKYFQSSGTTFQIRSKHYIFDIDIYEKSFFKTFTQKIGSPQDFAILALLPSYLEAGNSSLVYMVQKLMEKSQNPYNGFYLHNYKELFDKLNELHQKRIKTILFGVTYALLKMADIGKMDLPNLIIIETGGMKGKDKELIREELHQKLKEIFGTNHIYSEYGMTELFSQAYMLNNKFFEPASTLKILVRDIYDPFSIHITEATGIICAIDLANIYSCSFIETQDIGALYSNGTFNVLGRLDNSEIRGCNLLAI